MTKLTHAVRTAAILGLLVPLATQSAFAQAAPPRPRSAPRAPEAPDAEWPAPRIYVNGAPMVARGMLGVMLRPSSGAEDTLGLLIDDVEEGMPADKAGITRGARLVSADGIDLRLDPRDLGDSAAEALPESRLRRLIARKDAGDTVTFVVLADRRTTTRRVVLAESPLARSMRALRTGRRMLGLSFSQRGSMRDTASRGSIVSITNGGAADKAGLNEGDRILSIDGIDLRVPATDAGTADGVEARVARLRRALDAARDSEPVRLDVLADGRRRTVSVVPTREQGLSFSTAGFAGMADDIRASVRGQLDWSAQREEAARARSEAARARAEVQREMTELRRDQQRMRYDDADGRWSSSDEPREASRTTIRGRTDGATLVIRGLSLAAVDRDFAQQFGRGSEEGALVVRSRGEWEPLRAGDVILRIEGRGVREGNTLDVAFDRSRDQRIEILRDGRRETITLPATR
ncbi:MAG: PDZ domain-containing protein [Gemmatimonadaceae bacterium]|nr:PDZ domain-containing protein [Gemmatimonadaceae bacterium]